MILFTHTSVTALSYYNMPQTQWVYWGNCLIKNYAAFGKNAKHEAF